MTSPEEILPGVIFYSYLSAKRKEKMCLWNHHTLILQVSGELILETPGQRISMNGGELLLIGKNQLGKLTKTPLPGGNYETIVISLQEPVLRKIALEEKREADNKEADNKYIGPPNLLIPINAFLQGYFQSIVPYARSSGAATTDEMGILKVKEGVKLLLLALPALRNFLFDFSEPYKIDLEKFMLSNFRFNVPVEKFAELTGRSLAGFKRDFQKTFGSPPRRWLQDKRLNVARHLIGTEHQKSSAIYLDLGFESLAHFSHSFKKKFGKAPTEISYSVTDTLKLNPDVTYGIGSGLPTD
jgi:AraC-like DNA-binding protein